MKPRPSNEEILEQIIEKAPDPYAKQREQLLRKALGQDWIYPSIDGAVKAARGVKQKKVEGVNPGVEEWDTSRLYGKFYLLFHQIGTEIASARPSPWRDAPDVVLRSLKTYVQKCIELRRGGNRKHWREDRVLENTPVEKKLAKVANKTVAAIRLEAQQDEFPVGENLDPRAADKFAKRKVAVAKKLNRKKILRTKLG
jgi:hypothetical protein